MSVSSDQASAYNVFPIWFQIKKIIEAVTHHQESCHRWPHAAPIRWTAAVDRPARSFLDDLPMKNGDVPLFCSSTAASQEKGTGEAVSRHGDHGDHGDQVMMGVRCRNHRNSELPRRRSPVKTEPGSQRRCGHRHVRWTYMEKME